MSGVIERKSTRIQLRAKQDEKELLEQAASLKHTTVSAYLLGAALEKAREEIRSNEVIELSDRDRNLFCSLLDNPPEPNNALCDLMQRRHDDVVELQEPGRTGNRM